MGIVRPSGGGGSQLARNVGQCSLTFTGVAGDGTDIAFAFSQGDATFINLAAPASPKPLVAGIYAYTLLVIQDGGGEGGAFLSRLTVDDDWYSIAAVNGASLAAAAGNQIATAVAWYSDAASPFRASVNDASADTYSGTLYVQKIA